MSDGCFHDVTAPHRAFKAMVDDLEITLREIAARRSKKYGLLEAPELSDGYTGSGVHPEYGGVRGGTDIVAVGDSGENRAFGAGAVPNGAVPLPQWSMTRKVRVESIRI